MPPHPEAAENDRAQQQEHDSAAHQPQLFSTDGKDLVGVLSGDDPPLGLATMKVSLPRNAAGGDGHNAVLLLPARAAGIVAQENDGDPVADIGGQLAPKQDARAHHPAKAQSEPAPFHPGTPHDDDKHKNVKKGHAVVLGDDQVQRRKKEAVGGNEDHAQRVGQQLLVLQSGALIGQQKHQKELDHLGGLDVDGQTGDGDPVLVARIPRPAKGDEGQQDSHIKEEHPLPKLFGEQLDIHQGKDRIGHNADEDADALDHHIAVAVAEVAGGAVDE